MKEVLLILILLSMIGCRNANNLAEIHTGFELPHLDVIEFKDKWYTNGDGETLIVFKLTDLQLQELQTKCIDKGYQSLPIDLDIPDNTIYDFFNNKNSDGYYSLSIEDQNKMDYSIIVLDKSASKFIIYYTIY